MEFRATKTGLMQTKGGAWTLRLKIPGVDLTKEMVDLPTGTRFLITAIAAGSAEEKRLGRPPKVKPGTAEVWAPEFIADPKAEDGIPDLYPETVQAD